jgi:ubiquinone/menaquinone biosynthesis C-methylase UbiE
MFVLRRGLRFAGALALGLLAWVVLDRVMTDGAKDARISIEALAKTTIGKFFVRVLRSGMESRFRYRFFEPLKILKGADILPGQTVLEVGCGTGFFTVPAARLIGDQGRLVAMDVLSESVDFVSSKVQAANLKNVQVVKGDALATGLDAGGFDTVLLFGVIPAPMLPLTRLLPEMHRVLKADGILAVWPPVPGWLPQAILQYGLFTLSSKRNGVHNFRRC